LNKKGFAPWYGNEVERDIPIPVLGPDLIDLRTVEIAAEKTAQGLVDAREALLEKPAKIPAPMPEPEATATEAAPAAAPAAPKAMSKIEMIRAKSRGESVEPAPAAEATPAAAAPAPAPAKAAGGKKPKHAEAKPSLVWLGNSGLADLASSINA